LIPLVSCRYHHRAAAAAAALLVDLIKSIIN
jgi:hypothetical protein